MLIHHWRHPNMKAHALGFLQGFGELADACITLCSFGFFCSGFELRIARLRAKQQIKRKS